MGRLTHSRSNEIPQAGVGLGRERQLTRTRRDFVASVSHELRTPLARIRLFTETLQLKGERDEEERTDLGELIEEIVEGYVPVASQKGMRIIADAPSRIFSMVDPRAMRQIVVNLLDNALKYGPKGQTISIELERVGQVARIVITDQGPGIPSNDRRRMWEPFVRLGAKGTTDGSGIGLAVVRDLVALHDATIAIDDAPGGGARFTLTFAISDSAEGLPLRATGEFRTRRAVR